ncbi:hypothetical protein HKCCE3408_13230 [Rhodobacterales bacterium HKCCE3408]|nr:hypothetical protein [Rhodobacterales bacterium HKCCE3408]
MRRFFLVLLLVTFGAPASAQATVLTPSGQVDCRALANWLDFIAGPFGDDIHGQYIDSLTVMRRAAPAFVDINFQPVFGRTYGELSDGDRTAIREALTTCGGEVSTNIFSNTLSIPQGRRRRANGRR